MARPLRIEYSGAVYHVTSRGNKRLPIFEDDRDRLRFLSILAKTCKTYNWQCHAYCLMDNHYHLLIETLEANLSQGMRDLNGVYTQYFNRRHESTGHLIQGRYKAFVIEKETYLLEVARYVVLNPVRAKLISHPIKWKWSSYRETCGEIQKQDFLNIHWTLKLFGKRRSTAHRAYKKFVHEGIGGPSPLHDAAHNLIVGSPQFASAIWERAKDAYVLTEIPVTERMIGRPKLAELFHKTDTLDERNRGILLARNRCAYSITAIAHHLSLHRTTVSRIVLEYDK